MKQITFDRKRKCETPIGWSQVHKTTLSGNVTVEWRCPHIHFNAFTHKYERCSCTCRKDRTYNKHQHVYKIPPEEDELLDDKYKSTQTEYIIEYTNYAFMKQLENASANFIGSTSISASIVCSDQF